MRACVLIIVLWILELGAFGAEGVSWPTENPPVDLGDGLLNVYQATESKEVESGGFGCVREKGLQFHEGIDLRSFEKDARGESIDAVLAVMAGRVIYRNSNRSKSSYGRYLLIEHKQGGMEFITLYAHLRSFENGIDVGSRVSAGERVATMGRSANHGIPKSRAHLHFEVCLRTTDDFQGWYDWKEFNSKNDHGIFNGMNLVGIDPVLFFQETWYGAGLQSLNAVLEKEKTAFTIVVSTNEIPDFVRRHPALVNGLIPNENLGGWKIDYTWYGLPMRWTPLLNTSGKSPNGKVSLSNYHRGLVVENACRGMFDFKNGKPVPGAGLNSSLQLLFGYR